MIDNFNLFINNANALIFAVDLNLRVSEWNLKCEEVSSSSSETRLDLFRMLLFTLCMRAGDTPRAVGNARYAS